MSHLSVCPKCKYNRPLALNYCPHCKEEERNKKDPNGAMLSKMFEKMWVKVVTAEVLPSKKVKDDRKKTNSKSNVSMKSTEQEKQQATNMKSSNKFKAVQGARNSKTKWVKKSSRTVKSKRKIKNRV